MKTNKKYQNWATLKNGKLELLLLLFYLACKLIELDHKEQNEEPLQ